MLNFYIPKMTCGGCAKSVTQALLSVDPKARIETNLAACEVQVESVLDEDVFFAVLNEVGFPARRA
ncbi:MAG: heavy-metal-associated domain-containing protein [Serratia inhibens]|uniref:heavy-metal-associated domain-containing protein n=1 Tax=Serratia inhibens TaxID=2338073 RepID=UPI003C7E08D1